MKSEALAIAKEETRRQMQHDLVVSATTVLTHPITMIIAGEIATEYFIQKGYWAGFGGNRIRGDAIQTAILAAPFVPALQPIFSAVVKTGAEAIIKAAVK